MRQQKKTSTGSKKRRGKAIAQLSPKTKTARRHFPDLSAFRATLVRLMGKETTVVDLRRAERY
jgi:hypothetical protein